MEELKNEWFSSLEDLKNEVEKLGYRVEEINNEIITISYENEDAEDVYETYKLNGTEKTIYIDFNSKKIEVIK